MKYKLPLDFVLATGNPHKVIEIEAILDIDKITFKTLKDIGYTQEIVEDGTTFAQNAFIKANTLYQEGHMYVMAEDSGIEVEALDGRPGIYSARYAQMEGSQLDNPAYLLTQIEGRENRRARFFSCLCVITEGRSQFYTGSVEGTLTHEKSGEGGFGYDPIFIPDGYDKTMAQLSESIKNKISHRYHAFRKFGKAVASANQ